MLQIVAIPALHDNYIWAIVHPVSKLVVVVDPGESQLVSAFLKAQNLQLHAILITHHHWDHTNGITELVTKHPVSVYGPYEEIPNLTHPVSHHDTVSLQEMTLEFKVLEIPGHTLGHIGYFGHGWVFTGDTLFAAGCGRIFEGTPTQFYDSLNTLTKLPSSTAVYCGHEYTTKNLAFAKLVEPENIIIQQRIDEAAYHRKHNQPTLPSKLQLEMDSNPFLRCHLDSVKHRVEAHFQQQYPNPLSVFTALRQWKDTF